MSYTLTNALRYANNKRTISKRDQPSAPKLYPSYLEYRINNRIVRYDIPRYDIPHYQQPLQQLRQSLHQPRRQLQRPPSYAQNLMFPMYQHQQQQHQQHQQQQQQHPNVDQFCRSYGYKKIVPEAPKLIRRVSKNKSIRPIPKQQPVVLQIKPHNNQQTNKTQMYYKSPSKSLNKSKTSNKSKTPNKTPSKL